MYCREHKKTWNIGSNLFSSWRWETEEQQRQRYDELGFAEFEELNCNGGAWHHPECAACQPSRAADVALPQGGGDVDEVPF